MTTYPKLSVVIPIHSKMKHGEFFLWRSIQVLMRQTFKDFEIVVVQEGLMAENTNAGMRKAKGELIKILYLDDYLAHDNALQMIVDNFKDEDHWLATGCLHQHSETGYYEDPHSPHSPVYTQDIHTGNNRIGSPSVVTLRNKGVLFFDENLSWLLDADLYKRYYATYGPPKIVDDLNVVIGIGSHQTTHILPDDQKEWEFNYLKEKHVN